MTATGIFIGGTALAVWVWVAGLGRSSSNGDQWAGRKERDPATRLRAEKHPDNRGVR